MFNYEDNKIEIYINGKSYQVDKGLTIMAAADQLGFHIPRLCYHPKLSIEGACRVCIVEIEGMRNFVASCAYPVSEGMKIRTNTKELRRARRDIVELILDNHPLDCHICEKDGNCELQRLAHAMGIKNRHFEGEKKDYERDLSSPAVVRDQNKCILCGRCVRMCSEIQQINAIDFAHRGFKTTIMSAYDLPFDESVCTSCGQCVNVCPTAAFMEHNYTQDVFEKLDDPEYIKIVQVAPAVRAAIGEAFNLEAGQSMEYETVAALKKLGFDYVFDTQFSADLTIMEEASEFLERFTSGGKLPLITSCSSGWVKCMEQFYPDLIYNISTSKSPMEMMGSLIKTYLAQKLKVKPEKILSVAVMPCTAKKNEAQKEELKVNGKDTIDYVLTTREIAWMIKSAGIDFLNIQGEGFDSPLGLSSGAGAIFGVTGGVMEAAIRTAYELYTGETLLDIEVKNIRGLKGIKEGKLIMDGKEIRVAVSHGLGNSHQLLDLVKKEPGKYHFIEIMGCPGGCVGGGGQPYPNANHTPLDEGNLKKRAEALYSIDRKNTIRRSHENPGVQRLYKEFLGRPLSKISHEILHTHYSCKKPLGIVPGKRPPMPEGSFAKDIKENPKLSELNDYIESIRKREHFQSYLKAVLHKAQELFGYIDKKVMDFISMKMYIPTSKIWGVATFYQYYNLSPQGKYVISICMGTACYVKGADKVLEAIKQELKINVGETTGDGQFTIADTRCLGTCGLAPVMMINDKVYGKLTPKMVVDILKQYK